MPEHPPDELDRKSQENWENVDPQKRERCVEHLRAQIESDLLERWRDQLARGKSIGSDDPWFHFGVGMSIRNCLREVLPDNELPPVEYTHVVLEDGSHPMESNWDDFYTAALREAVAE